jgi:hypothetical protein
MAEAPTLTGYKQTAIAKIRQGTVLSTTHCNTTQGKIDIVSEVNIVPQVKLTESHV